MARDSLDVDRYDEECRWCHQMFKAFVPGSNHCGPVCRAVESLFIGAQSRARRDNFLVSLEARADALKADG